MSSNSHLSSVTSSGPLQQVKGGNVEGVKAPSAQDQSSQTAPFNQRFAANKEHPEGVSSSKSRSARRYMGIFHSYLVAIKYSSRFVHNSLLCLHSTVVILINATTLMHKSTLSTNNFGNNHFGQKYQKQNILRIFRRL